MKRWLDGRRRLGACVVGVILLGSLAVLIQRLNPKPVDGAIGDVGNALNYLDALERVNDSEEAKSEVPAPIRLQGQVVDPYGKGVDHAVVEIWSMDYTIGSAKSPDGARESGDEAALCNTKKTGTFVRIETQAQGMFVASLTGENDYCVRARHGHWSASLSQPIAPRNGRLLILQLNQPLSLTGYVVDSDKRPLPNVVLKLTNRVGPSDAQFRSTQSDAAGKFELHQLDPGSYEVTIQERYAVAQPREIVILPRRPPNDLIIKLYQVVRIRGRIVGSDGEPVMNVSVTARSPYDPDLILGQASSNAQGMFDLPSSHLSPVALTMQRMVVGTTMSDGRERPTTLPLQANPACLEFSDKSLRANMVAVTSTEETVDIGTVYMRRRNSPVRGEVRDRDGRLIAAELTFKYVPDTPRLADCSQFPFVLQLATTDDGAFKVELPLPGRFQVQVVPREVEYTPAQTIETVVEAGVTSISLQLE